jgi:type I restriction enzyme, R subunit
MPMNIKELGLESIIVNYLRDVNGYVEGTSDLYSKDEALVKSWLETFLVATQPDKVARSMCFASPSEKVKFYARFVDALAKRGVTDVLRNGFKFNGTTFDLYFPIPSEQNPSAQEAYEKNGFGVIRQLHYSKTDTNDAIDFAVFVNGLPLATFELKNHYTHQTVENAIKQYQTDRDPKEMLLKPKRCAVHFAVDDTDVYMCTELKGAESWFLPFNRGVNGGAGNPVIPGKTMTSYLWEEVFAKRSLSNIIENFAQVIVSEDKKTHKQKERVIWPRYHQLDAVRRILAATQDSPVGRKFLIQHSAGSGKSNTITWLAYQLVLLQKADTTAKFDSIIVVTDRINLDRQIRDNINAYARLANTVGWADHSDTLRELLQGGKKIVVSTIHKFAFILEEIGSSLKGKNFAIVIDEAHSSQNGEMASSLAASVSGNVQQLNEDGEPEDTEDKIHRIIQGRKLAKNANYYAFTATPKNKTLEMFGEEYVAADGTTYGPFHEYTMKQAIEEEFILDVIRNYTPYESYYEVVKKVEDDPEFNKEKAPKRIRAYVESQPETVEAKSRIIVDHFCTKVFKKIGGRARAMVATSSIERAIEFYKHISRLLEEQGGKFKAIVAFTDKEIDGHVVTESSLNGFPSSAIEDKIEEEPYRILVVADKFQTGYDQPLLHTMYVDKVLTDLKAVQTLSRLNRAHPKKFDTFVLDFANHPDDIREAFQRYYKTTILEGESDVNKLNDLTDTIERKPFYTEEDRRQVVELRLSGSDEDRQKIDAILDADVERFKNELNEEEQIRAKSAMKNFCRIYPFFAAIMPYESPDWEKQYLFCSLLVKKLPKLKREDFTTGLLETIDFDKYRIQKQEERAITLENVNAAVSPVPVGSGAGIPEVELDVLSHIVEDFNAVFGGIEWSDEDEVRRQIRDLPRRMAQDVSFVNAVKNGDEHVAQIQFNDIIQNMVATMGEEKLEFMQHYFDNAEFRNFVNERVFQSCLQGIREKSPRKAPTLGWAPADSEETDGGYLAAAESGADEDDGK